MTAALEQIMLDCQEVNQLSEEATGVHEPNLQFMAFLGLGITLLIAVIRRHRME